MTDKQRKFYYFPAWNRACLQQSWHMLKGRLQGQRAESFGLKDVNAAYQAVWDHALALAAQQHRAVTADDLRHACHVVALGKDKSSNALTNAEVDRVVSLFKLLANADDLDAAMSYFYPTNAERRRLMWALEHRFPEAYVAALSQDIFHTGDWRSLTTECLRGLEQTLFKRKKHWNQPVRPPVPTVRVDDDNPF